MILLTGGTGFLGGHVLKGLLAANLPVRVCCLGAHDWRQSKDLGVQVVVGHIGNIERMKRALDGCNAVINLAGCVRPADGYSVQETNGEATGQFVATCEQAGVQRFVHISCLSASAKSKSVYLQSKAEGEAYVKQGKFHWTVMRPAFMFGDKFPVLEPLIPLVRAVPVIPVPGGGLNEWQPVSVEDVAACIVQSIYDRNTSGQTYDLVGPKTYSLSELIKLIGDSMGRPKPIISVSSTAFLKAAKVVEKILPKGTFTEDFVHLLLSDSAGKAKMMQETFQVKMTPLEESLQWLIIKS